MSQIPLIMMGKSSLASHIFWGEPIEKSIEMINLWTFQGMGTIGNDLSEGLGWFLFLCDVMPTPFHIFLELFSFLYFF